jgi:recombination protein RecT
MTETKNQAPENNKSQVPATNGEKVGQMKMSEVTMTQLLSNWARKPFTMMLPGTDEAEKERAFNLEAYYAIAMINKSEALQNCDRKSIIDSLVNIAAMGLTLSPELRLAYLIPRKGKCYAQSSYMGKREILIRAGIVKDIWCNIVYEKETFVEKAGTEHTIEHHTVPFGDKGKIIGGYWSAELINGTRPYGIMDIDRIMLIASRSDAVKSGKGSPWDSDKEEMIKKTLINNSWKHLPKTGISDNVVKAIEADSAFDTDEFDDWLKRKEAEEGSAWEKDEKAPGKARDFNITEATVVHDESKKETAKENVSDAVVVNETIPPENSSEGDLSTLGSDQNGKNLL